MSCLAYGLTSLFYLKSLAIRCEGSTPGAITVPLDGLQHLTNVDIKLTFAHLCISDVVELGRGLDQHLSMECMSWSYNIAVLVLRVCLL